MIDAVKYELMFTDKAESDLLDIVRHIARDNKIAALNFESETIKSLQALTNTPKMAPLSVNKRLKAEGFRKLILGNYIAWYKIDELNRRINIIRILHGAMKQETYL